MFNKKNQSTQGREIQQVERPETETDLRQRKDRIGRYFKKYLKKFIFDEFSESYMEKAGIREIMKGVPIPLRKQDLAEFAGGSGLKALHLAENMAWVMGSDPQFAYTKDYVHFLNKLFGPKACEGLLKEGRDAAERGDYDNACIHFRACLCLNPTYLHAMYSYARVCRAMYLESDNEEYIGRFKAEAMDYFELTTEMHPKFAEAYYFLGYAYLNMGLYIKAELTWNEFLKKSNHAKDRKEIRERLRQLDGPIKIEHGYNAVLAGRYEEGIDRLEPFLNTQFKTWWPLSYYLGVSYIRTGNKRDAVTSFKRVLTMNASHVETMQELAAIYAADNDKDNEKKYRTKIDLILGNHKMKEEEANVEKFEEREES